jgi:hypothetical protein
MLSPFCMVYEAILQGIPDLEASKSEGSVHLSFKVRDSNPKATPFNVLSRFFLTDQLIVLMCTNGLMGFHYYQRK